MTRRTTLCALMLVLFLLVPSPALAKGPQQVEVRDLATGMTTLLTWDNPELMPLMELVEWPAIRQKPHLVANGRLPHVATLAWQFEDGQSVWLDRVYSDGAGTAWIARRDHLSGNSFMTWGRVRSPFALDQLLAALGESPAKAQTTGSTATAKAPTAGARATRGGFDGASFGWGAAAAALLAGALSLALRRRRAARA